jgi:hypothetical protein
MVNQHKFSGTDGMLNKIRLLTSNCASAIDGMPRSMVIGVTAPDPVSTPDCTHHGLRGFKILTLDNGLTPTDIATLLGAIYGMLDVFEDECTQRFGEEFREFVDDARDTHGHARGMAVTPLPALALVTPDAPSTDNKLYELGAGMLKS